MVAGQEEDPSILLSFLQSVDEEIAAGQEEDTSDLYYFLQSVEEKMSISKHMGNEDDFGEMNPQPLTNAISVSGWCLFS